MKIQDVLFFAVFLMLLYKQNPRYAVLAGLFALILSIPLFSLWIFFTAQHLVYFAALYFLLAIVLYLKNDKTS